jgi:hypothetical protein
MTRRNVLLEALQWIVANPEANPATVGLIAKTAIARHDNEVTARAEGATSPLWSVAIYLVDRQYGGPEEGGWWYEAGVRIDAATLHVPVSPFPDRAWHETFVGPLAEATAESTMQALQALLDSSANVGRRDIGSVLSVGRYQAMMFEGIAPLVYPATKPQYE